MSPLIPVLHLLLLTPVYKFLGISDCIVIYFHIEGHMVTDEDLIYLLDFCDYSFYGKKVKRNLEDLKTSLYLEEKNYDTFFDMYLKDEK